MGNYTKKLAQKVINKGPSEGFCVICGDYGKLSRDHVPPKGCNNIRDQELRVFGSTLPNKGTTSQGGTHFKTLCEKCSSTRLGTEYDPELIKLANEITSIANSISTGILTLPDQIFSFVKPQRLARAVVGHTLAAVAVDEARTGLRSAPFPDTLRDYFLNSDSPLPQSLNIYYWLHPSHRQVVVKGAAKVSAVTGQGLYGHIFKFLPLGFWLIWEKPSDATIDLQKVIHNKSMKIDEMAQIKIELKNIPSLDFPERPTNLNDKFKLLQHWNT